MSDTPETDEAAYPEDGVGADVVNADLSRRLERERNELREALRELHEARSTLFPAFSQGAAAQDAWAARIDAAHRRAEALLARLSEV